MEYAVSRWLVECLTRHKSMGEVIPEIHPSFIDVENRKISPYVFGQNLSHPRITESLIHILHIRNPRMA